uniref:Rap8 n=1 Tax=Rhynchosciara americana TaxID=7186 RepID=O18529_RHYAM|nr:Rap8 [Rhynchosciara americana]
MKQFIVFSVLLLAIQGLDGGAIHKPEACTCTFRTLDECRYAYDELKNDYLESIAIREAQEKERKDLIQQVQVANDKICKLSEENHNLSVAVKQYKEENKNLKETIGSLKKTIEELKKQLSKAQEDLRSCGNALECCNREKEALLRTIYELECKIKQLQEEINGYKEEIAKLNKELDEFKHKLARCEKENREKQQLINEYKCKIESLIEEIRKLKQQLSACENERNDLKCSINKYFAITSKLESNFSQHFASAQKAFIGITTARDGFPNLKSATCVESRPCK